MDGALSETIGAIYDTCLEPSAWQRALACVCDYLDAEASTINYHDLLAGEALLAYEHGTSPYWSKVYHEQFSDLNPLIAPLMQGRIGKPALIADRMATEDFHQTRLYREWCAPQGYEDFMDMVVYRDQRRVGALSCVRLRDQPRFGAPDLAAFDSIAGHIRRALDISNRFEVRKVEAALFESFIDLLPAGVVVLDRQGRVQQQNVAAQRWLSNLGQPQRIGERLALSRLNLTKLLETVEHKRVFMSGLKPIDGGRTVSGITALSLGGSIGALRGWPIAVLITGETFAHPPPSTLLATMFGLTGAEIRVLRSILAGQTGPQTARTLGVSLPTVRTHIARLLSKTHAANQAELVQIVAGAAGPLRAI